MKTRLQAHKERREALVARCAALRGEARQHFVQVERSLWVADLAIDAGRALKRRPLVIAVIVGALAVAQPARLLRWLSRGFALYSFVQNVRAALRQP
jgi:hypothetical protein